VPEDESTFGKPSAPRELWEGSASRFRQAFLAEAAKPDAELDVARAALHLAGEDDAVASRSAVPLPVEAYAARIESLCDDFVASGMPAGDNDSQLAAALDAFLYTTCRFRLPTGWAELHSPYRTYLHNVLAQRVGVRCALATIHLAVLTRLQQRGVLSSCLEAALPLGPGLPFTRAASSGGQPLSAAALLRETLGVLTRAFWAWEWEMDQPSGFLAAAQAATGATGRVGRVFGGATVMQPTGRPYGDLVRARLALERLCALDGGAPSAGQRDLAVLLAHLGRKAEALSMLRAYRDSEAGRAAAAAAAPRPEGVSALFLGAPLDAGRSAAEAAVLHELVLELERATLESALHL